MTQQAPNRILSLDTGFVFSGKATGKLANGWEFPCDFTPDVNPNFVFPSWANDIIVWLLFIDEPLYLFGPTGCGKTATTKQIVTKLNYPVYEITGHSRLEFPEMVGHHTVKDGNMHFEYGPLAMAMKGGGLFLLNEIDLLDPSTAAGLNSVLDGYPLTIPENGGELIKPHPMFKFVATANSNGGSDSTGMYQGVLRQNMAFMDRFVLVEASYLEKEIEEIAIQKAAPTLPKDLVTKMVAYANAVRKLFIGDSDDGAATSIEVTFSTRTLIRWAELIVCFEPLKSKGVDVVLHALERALMFRASKASQRALRELHQRMF